MLLFVSLMWYHMLYGAICMTSQKWTVLLAVSRRTLSRVGGSFEVGTNIFGTLKVTSGKSTILLVSGSVGVDA